MGDIILSGGSSSSTGGGGGPIEDGANPLIEATVLDLVDSNPLTVAIVDANGDQISSFGGGTQYAEDTPSTAGELVTMAGVVRNDTRGSLVGTDGDRTEIQVNSSGDVRVDGSAVTQPVSNAGLTNIDVALSTRLKPADTLTAVTTVGTITNVVHVDDNGGSLTVDGTVSLGAGAAVIGHVITDTGSTTAVTGNVTVVQGTGTNLHTVIDSGTTTVTQGTGTNLHTVVDSGSITVTNAAGASAVNIQDGGNSITVDGSVSVSGTVGISGWGLIAPSGSTTWNSGTALNSTISQDVRGYAGILFRITHSGTINGVISIEGSLDSGTTFDPVVGMYWNIATPLVDRPQLVSQVNGGLIGNVNIGYIAINVLAYTHIRLRLSTVCTITDAFVISYAGSTLPFDHGQPAGIKIFGTGAAGNETATSGQRAVGTTGTNSNNALLVSLMNTSGVALGTTANPVIVAGPTTINTAVPLADFIDSAVAVANAASPTYGEGFVVTLSTDLAGNLRTKVSGLVSDARESYVNGDIQPLSLTSDGRLRVATSPADNYIDFFDQFNPYGDADAFGIPVNSPYDVTSYF